MSLVKVAGLAAEAVVSAAVRRPENARKTSAGCFMVLVLLNLP
jgi:hypothetical protein